MDADRLIQQIDAKKFATTSKNVRKATVLNHFDRALRPLMKFISQEIAARQPAQANLKVMGTPTVISLEINVINLPYTSIRPMKRLVTNNGKMTANVYVMIASPDVNRSKFRLDRVDSADRFPKRITPDLKQIASWFADQLKKIQQNRKLAKERPKATKKAAKAHRRRSTRKKKSTRRRSRKRK